MLKTKRLELVGFDGKYAKDLYELWGDFEVIKFTYIPLLTTIDECIDLIKHQVKRTDIDFMDRFVILLNNRAIGTAGCICKDKVNSIFGLYYQISRVNWGCGYATEAASAIMQYVLNKYPKAIFQAEAVSQNVASTAVLMKFGFKQTHIEKNGFSRNNYELDLIHYSKD